ncbi:FAD-dependent monooxygenase [Mesorhizobium sp. M4B.F.Ca.ET.215.01.1.1]|uniref:NAD(P)/FAD-dependent oxidoreductase n=1 Tax=unclassified Mesorhizobium TaxID=325217 RepID=UPI000FCC2711|nr:MULTISPECIES: NAD(P)/FAD-dependent oxidoreductase [unclassified Mesorhizobium]RVD35374.1 FAD-dependent monooxygenase [Mesorhizobium sp. M4B.F.Ca.ET.019.03.1.1]TGQ13007.1 FAD-dependent monooxygenase [Mesorhizobium sp. M4B.F.Ca.ET.215.01.1.1]TGQ46374.1 FAD-dependent monooxygenase [Mesorhizobium sp. M00.F.Ca.ET.220.01.1.1]TGR06220.1 FAD-dependent monooxygenase [Mesorhizobium sp. M4B.F.Ca.ET.203.01.1.1]TGT48415.1 FAD-dependent monooxygenase [Mesorhizobium sp. M4B.F.Ca.ET.169.01.1.1]
MTRLSTHDAIIIGAGPAGTSVALTLARRGWAVAIVEKRLFPRRKVCGEYISASNLALLDRLEIGDAWRASAGPQIRRVGFFSGNTRVEAAMPRARAGRCADDGFGRALGRDVLDTLLLQAACSAGAEIFQPFWPAAIDRDGDMQTVRIQASNVSDEHTMLRAPVIVAAHGSWEPGPLPSQLAKSSRPSDLLGFKAHFIGSSLATDLMPLLVFPGGYGGMVFADHGRLSISCCIRRDVLARLRGNHPPEQDGPKENGHLPAADAVCRHLMSSCRGVSDVLEGARLDGPWLAAGPIRPGIRACYEHDIFRVGNAAGESHPIIAEGISMALQSGWLLASELGGAPTGQAGREAAGRRYEAAWRGLFSTRVYAAAGIARLAFCPGGPALMRVAVRNLPQALTLGAHLSGKTRRVPGFG